MAMIIAQISSRFSEENTSSARYSDSDLCFLPEASGFITVYRACIDGGRNVASIEVLYEHTFDVRVRQFLANFQWKQGRIIQEQQAGSVTLVQGLVNLGRRVSEELPNGEPAPPRFRRDELVATRRQDYDNVNDQLFFYLTRLPGTAY